MASNKKSPEEILSALRNLEGKRYFRKDRLEKTVYTLDEIKRGVRLSRSEISKRASRRKFKNKTPLSVGENRKKYFREYQRRKFGVKPENYIAKYKGEKE